MFYSVTDMHIIDLLYLLDKVQTGKSEASKCRYHALCFSLSLIETVVLCVCADFKVDGTGEKFGEEMYEAVSGAKEQEQTTSGSNGFDSPIENKSSPAATSPRSYDHAE